ncbi:MAG: glycine betaine/proline transport system substrate-binding protein [Gammaproteobacteria bacterium]|jgi:glycine betaine/proline transport system substrate-binding protein
MKLKKSLMGVLVAASLGVSSYASAADVVIGVPNWPSVAATASILKAVIEDNFGLEVELQNASNPVVFEAMDSGSMHIHPEVWLPNQANLNNTFVNQKKTVLQAPKGVPAFQGMCVTKGTAERTGIKKLSDLSDPDMAQNFDTDGDGKGEVWIGASGWASTSVEKIRAKSYGYDETMNLMEMDESVALAGVDNAVAKKEDSVFFCYTPHHLFALHELVILDEPAYDESKWNVVQPTDDPNWLEVSNAPVAWDKAYLHVHYAVSLKKAHPGVADMLNSISLTTDQVSAMTYALVVDQKDPNDYAKEWVMANEKTVDSWLK